PIAPAFWAFRTLAVNAQVPRSITAILPETAAAFVNGVWQPSLVGATGSTTTIACCVTPPWVSGAPNDAALPGSEPPPKGTSSSGAWLRNSGALKLVCSPSQVRFPVLMAEATRWAAVFWSQWSPVVSSNRNLSHRAGSDGGP